MLTIKVPEQKFLDNKTNEIIDVPGAELRLEHSLISVRKWEGRWHVPFLSEEKKTPEQMIDYIKCMTINRNSVPAVIYNYLPADASSIIAAYI